MKSVLLLQSMPLKVSANFEEKAVTQTHKQEMSVWKLKWKGNF